MNLRNPNHHPIPDKNRRWWHRAALAIAGPGCILLLGVSSLPAAEVEEIADNRIETAIDGELWGAKGVNANSIDVAVNDGIVTLSGTVRNILAEDAAIRISRMCKGVRSVVDNIEVAAEQRPDRELRADVLNAIARDPATETWEIDVEASNGTVTLGGSVESWAERELAAKVAKGTRGVRALRNEIDIEYVADRDDFEISQDIEQRLNWDVRLDDELVTVDVDDGKVTLNGAVGSAYEKSLAYSDAWVTGVNAVDDQDLKVTWWSRDTMQRKTAWKDLEDSAIRDAVVKAFLYDPRVDSFNPEVTVLNGVVTLTGVVDNLKAKRAAAQDAKNTVGVISVKNYLKVRPLVELSNEELERDIANALLLDPFVNRFDVTVEVMDGQAYLYGKIDSFFEKSQAEDVTARVSGVTDVRNYLDVSYDPIVDYSGSYDWDATLYDYDFDYETTRVKSDQEIKEEIKSQLWWSPWVDSDEVKVTVDSGTATLKGTVDSWSERDKAAENAIEGGAVKVVNQLDVQY